MTTQDNIARTQEILRELSQIHENRLVAQNTNKVKTLIQEYETLFNGYKSQQLSKSEKKEIISLHKQIREIAQSLYDDIEASKTQGQSRAPREEPASQNPMNILRPLPNQNENNHQFIQGLTNLRNKILDLEGRRDTALDQGQETETFNTTIEVTKNLYNRLVDGYNRLNNNNSDLEQFKNEMTTAIRETVQNPAVQKHRGLYPIFNAIKDAIHSLISALFKTDTENKLNEMNDALVSLDSDNSPGL